MNLTQILIALFSLAGIIFFVRRGRDKKSKKRILDLENEMLSCHREILELQNQIARLQNNEDPEQYRLYAVDKKKQA